MTLLLVHNVLPQSVVKKSLIGSKTDAYSVHILSMDKWHFIVSVDCWFEGLHPGQVLAVYSMMIRMLSYIKWCRHYMVMQTVAMHPTKSCRHVAH